MVHAQASLVKYPPFSRRIFSLKNKTYVFVKKIKKNNNIVASILSSYAIVFVIITENQIVILFSSCWSGFCVEEKNEIIRVRCRVFGGNTPVETNKKYTGGTLRNEYW